VRGEGQEGERERDRGRGELDEYIEKAGKE
jgi:hypothetical protein